MNRMRLWALLSAIVVALIAPLAAQAQADIGVRRVGVRGGLTISPDQGHVGLHLNAGQFAPQVRFQPSLEVGFGSDRVVLAINVDALYEFEASGWSPYAGGGLGIGVIGHDRGRGNGDDDVNVEAGLNLVAGFEWGAADKYMLEARAGIGDIPDFKVSIGINF